MRLIDLTWTGMKGRKEIAGLRGNTKHLYNLITQLAGTVSENPLPECENDEGLADSYSQTSSVTQDLSDSHAKYAKNPLQKS